MGRIATLKALLCVIAHLRRNTKKEEEEEEEEEKELEEIFLTLSNFRVETESECRVHFFSNIHSPRRAGVRIEANRLITMDSLDGAHVHTARKGEETQRDGELEICGTSE